MLGYLLTTFIILTGGILYYIYFIAPKFDPSNKAAQYLKQNMLDEAIMEYKKVLDKKPGDFVTHYHLAQLFLQKKEIDQAVIHLENLININKWNYEIDKLDVQKKLGEAYLIRDELEKSFQTYIDILKLYPVDPDALYNVAFVALGQGEFEIAQRYFDKLVRVKADDFDVLFGAGICSYQNQRGSDAANYFKQALALKTGSDVGNLAMAFALQKKSDFKLAANNAAKVADHQTENAIRFVARRLQALLNLQARKYDEALRLFEELLSFTESNEMTEEKLMTLYDIGFAAFKAEKTSHAYEHWNELYKLDKNYQNVQSLVTILRREMEVDFKLLKESFAASVEDYVDEWLSAAFPKDFLWNICGLKSDKEINLKNIMVTARVGTGKAEGGDADYYGGDDYSGNLERFIKLDNENFRIISNRMLGKMGYKVDQILQTYRESDGVDFLAINQETKEKVLIWVRRWTKTKVGEIPLRNFAQAINDMKTRGGLFITTIELTQGAETSLKNLSKVTVIYPHEMGEYLNGLV